MERYRLKYSPPSWQVLKKRTKRVEKLPPLQPFPGDSTVLYPDGAASHLVDTFTLPRPPTHRSWNMRQEMTRLLPLEIQVVLLASQGASAESRGWCKGCPRALRSGCLLEAGWQSPAKLKLVLWGHCRTEEPPQHPIKGFG